MCTAFLLALYAFIATPVSYWHHHQTNGEQSVIEQHSQKVSNSTVENEANCKICSQHYSESVNDAIIIDIPPFQYRSRHRECDLLKILPDPGYNLSNKGPPIFS